MAQGQSTAKLVLYWFAPTLIIVGLSGFIVISSLVGMFPRTFGPIFGGIINYHEGGVYADCSLHENRNNSICSGMKASREDRNWEAIKRSKKASPFTLHGK